MDYLIAATADAYAALWRYLLEVDLVSVVSAGLRSADEAVLWQLSDPRAADVRIYDHLWLRILSVAATLESRGYSAPVRVVLDVDDDLGFADGRYLLDTTGESATVSIVEEIPDDAAAVAMTVNELSALFLGGVSASTLVRAGRITELRPGSSRILDTAFRTATPPHLSVWF